MPHPSATAVERLRQLIRIPTISREDADQVDWGAFDAYRRALRDGYPGVHGLEAEIVAGHSLLIRWPGRESGDPTVLMAHHDVVPAADEGWTHGPFDADITGDADGETAGEVLWGRGAIDDKGSMAAILEAAESLLEQGFAPRHDVYPAFGHDEETTGSGAAAIVDRLAERGVRPALVLDEGGAVVEGVFPGVRRPIAVIGVSEKGSVNVVLSVTQPGGHASTPPRRTASTRLARALVDLERHPFPRRLDAPTRMFVRTLGRHATGPLRAITARVDVIAPLLVAAFSRLSDETRALLGTTAAATMLRGSAAANVLPDRAEAVVNIRIAVGSSLAATLRHVRRAIRDPQVHIEARHPVEPSPVSPAGGAGWDAVTASVAALFPDAISAPYVMLGATDSRHFAALTDSIYRFTPFRLSTRERASIHGVDERMPLRTFRAAIEWYEHLLRSR